MGPYETEADALREPMPREVHALHTAGQVRSGDPDRVVSGTVLRHLTQACAAAGVELGAHDRRTLAWLAGWGTDTAQVVIGLISRAYEAGKAGRPTPETNDHGVRVDLISVGTRVDLVDGDGGHAFATVHRMDSPRMGIVELDDGTRAWFHVENVTRVMPS